MGGGDIKIKDKIPKNWLDKYFEKSGDDFLSLKNLIVTDKGFASFDVKDDAIVIIQVFGDGKFWDNFFVNLAKNLGKSKIIFATKRNPGAFCIKYKYKIIGTLLEKEVHDGWSS